MKYRQGHNAAKSLFTAGAGLHQHSLLSLDLFVISIGMRGVERGSVGVADDVVVLAQSTCDFAARFEVAGRRVSAANSEVLCREKEDCSLCFGSESLHLNCEINRQVCAALAGTLSR